LTQNSAKDEKKSQPLKGPLTKSTKKGHRGGGKVVDPTQKKKQVAGGQLKTQGVDKPIDRVKGATRSKKQTAQVKGEKGRGSRKLAQPH